MNHENLWEEIMKSAMKDPEFQWAQNKVQNTEKEYLEVCKSLTPEQKLVIEDYIAACELMGDHLAVTAYHLGKQHK